MRKDRLVRVGGAAAILAGLLRAAASFAGGAGSEVERQALYFIIDVLLLLGALAAYLPHADALGNWGAGAFLTAITGILLVRSSRAVPGFDLYPEGAALVAIGWVGLSFTRWKQAGGTAFVPLLFVLSVLLGFLSQIPGRAAALLGASGVTFGAAMVGVGRQLLSAAAVAPNDKATRRLDPGHRR